MCDPILSGLWDGVGGEDMSRIQQVGQMQASNKAAGSSTLKSAGDCCVVSALCMFIMGEVKLYPQDFHDSFHSKKI